MSSVSFPCYDNVLLMSAVTTGSLFSMPRAVAVLYCTDATVIAVFVI